MKKYFFEIPVYRLSYEKYMDEEEQLLLQLYNNIHLKNGQVKSSIQYQEFKENMNKYRDIWKYNEIIGYIRLYILGLEIRGEYYQHKTTRIRKTRTKHFEFITLKLVSEKSLAHKSNDEIFIIILEYLNQCCMELKKMYIDTKDFENIGKYIDWNSFIKDKNKCKN